MRTIPGFARLSVLGILAASSAIVAHASTIVDGTDVIYAAGTQSAEASTAGGTLPVSISASGVASFTFSVTGSVILNVGTGSNVNDADGVGAAVSSSFSSGFGSISGVTLPHAGELVGVFLGAGGPTGAAPSALNFVTSGTSFSSLSPLLDQAFFIGDGLTGDGIGSLQSFIVPTGATQLFLGISDACGYSGSPSCYADNSGSFTVSDTVTLASTATPEPSCFLLVGTGVLSLLGVAVARQRLTPVTASPLA